MYIELELLSDTCIGSGESIAGIIDTDVVFNSLGIPYIPAKRIKGVLREAAEDYALIDESYTNVIDDLFGKAGNDTSGRLIISNGEIENYTQYKEIIKRGKKTEEIQSLFYEDNVKETFTYVRTQTAIKAETGIAKKNTLRNIRVLKKGLVFKFPINDIYEEQLELLKGACAFAKHIGVNRNRGYGFVKMTVKEGQLKEAKSENKGIDKLKDRVKYKITLQSPVILEENHIAGSTLLGICASKYIKENRIDQNEINGTDRFSKMFLSDKVIFSNGYISTDKVNCVPTPITFMKVKNSKTDKFINIANIDTELDKKERYVSIPYQYGYMNEEEFSGANINREVSCHHRRSEDKNVGRATEKSGEYFSYEAICSGTEFTGEICGSEDKLKDIIECFKSDNTIHLGASKSAQYGKATITFSKPNDIETEVEGENISLLFTSPMIVKNRDGIISTDKNDLLDELGIDNDLVEKVYLKTTEVGGFNTKWGLPKERTIAIKEGSVIVLKEQEGIEKLVNVSHGERVSEGYGRLMVINTNVTDEVTLTMKELEKSESLTKVTTGELGDEFTKSIIFNLYKNSFKRKVASLIEMKSRTKNFVEYMCNEEITNSAIANIVNYLNVSKSYTEFEYNLKDAKERIAKKETEKNSYEKICDAYLQIDGDCKKVFDEILRDDFDKINNRSSISQVFSNDYAKAYLESCDSFELYKEYMNYLFKIIKYRRRKKEVINNG